MGTGTICALGDFVGILQHEIDAFKKLQPELEAKHMGEWVLICHQQLVGYFASFDAAADDAIERFGSGPFLIRQVGAKPLALPASLAYTRTSA